MGINQIVEILEKERECVKRNVDKDCDKDCGNCDLVLKDEEIEEMLTAYTLAISILKTIQGDRKVMNTTNHVAGGYNEFTIL